MRFQTQNISLSRALTEASVTRLPARDVAKSLVLICCGPNNPANVATNNATRRLKRFVHFHFHTSSFLLDSEKEMKN